ncbi:MAG TPA: hypothetical protein VF942_07455 [Acidimicrobiales bacterium]
MADIQTFQECSTVFVRLGDDDAGSAGGLGVERSKHADRATARDEDGGLRVLRRAGAVSDQVGDDAGKVLATYGAAVVAQQEGDHATARPLFDSACRAFERLGVPLAAGLALAGVAGCDELAGDAAGARAGYKRLVILGEAASEVGLIAAGPQYRPVMLRRRLTVGLPSAAISGRNRPQLTSHTPEMGWA